MATFNTASFRLVFGKNLQKRNVSAMVMHGIAAPPGLAAPTSRLLDDTVHWDVKEGAVKRGDSTCHVTGGRSDRGENGQAHDLYLQ